MKIGVEISARHIHLCKEDLVKLFGTAALTVRNSLSQKGEFAANETVEVVGPRDRIKSIRVLGPIRAKTQLELSITDAMHLGVAAPLALSGEGIGETIRIIGLKGEITANVAMIAKRHCHLSVRTANKLRVKNGDLLKLKIDGPRETVFGKVVARISENFNDKLHLDTDEGNAAGVHGIMYAEIIK